MLSESFEGKDRVIGLNHNIAHFISLRGEGKAREGGRNIAIHFKCTSRVYIQKDGLTRLGNTEYVCISFLGYLQA